MDIEGALAVQKVFGQGVSPEVKQTLAEIGGVSDSIPDIAIERYKPEHFSSYQDFRQSMQMMEGLNQGTHPALQAERRAQEIGSNEQEHLRKQAIIDKYDTSSLNPLHLVPGFDESLERQRKQELGEFTPLDAQEWAVEDARRTGNIQGLGGLGGAVATGAQSFLKGVTSAFPGAEASQRGLEGMYSAEEVRRQGGRGQRVLEVAGSAAPYLAVAPAAGAGLGAAAGRVGLAGATRAMPILQTIGRSAAPIAATQAGLSAVSGRSAGETLEDTSVAALIGAAIPAVRPLAGKAFQAVGKAGEKLSKGKVRLYGRPVPGPAPAATSRQGVMANVAEKKGVESYGQVVKGLADATRMQYQKGILDFTKMPIESVAEGILALGMVQMPAYFRGEISGQKLWDDAKAGGFLDLVLSTAMRGAPYQQLIKADLSKAMTKAGGMDRIINGAKNKALEMQRMSEADKAAKEIESRPLSPEEGQVNFRRETESRDPIPSAASAPRARDMQRALKEVDQIHRNTPESALMGADTGARSPMDAALRAQSREEIIRGMDGPEERLSPEEMRLLDENEAKVRMMQMDDGQERPGLPSPMRGLPDPGVPRMEQGPSYDRFSPRGPEAEAMGDGSRGVMPPPEGPRRLVQSGMEGPQLPREIREGRAEAPAEPVASPWAKNFDPAMSQPQGPPMPPEALQPPPRPMESPPVGPEAIRVPPGDESAGVPVDPGAMSRGEVGQPSKGVQSQAPIGAQVKPKRQSVPASKRLAKKVEEVKAQEKRMETSKNKASSLRKLNRLREERKALEAEVQADTPINAASVKKGESVQGKSETIRGPRTTDPKRGQRGMAINPASLIPTFAELKQDLKPVGRRIQAVLDGSAEVIKRYGSDFIARPLFDGRKVVLPKSIEQKLHSAVTRNKLLNELTRSRDDKTIFHDTETASYMFYIMGLKGFKDATWRDTWRDPINVLGEPVVNIVDGLHRGVQKGMAHYRDVLYGPDGPLVKMRAEYGGRKKEAEKKFRNSMKKVSDALEYDAVLKKRGLEFINENGFSNKSELTASELKVYDAAKSIYDFFRAEYAKKYNRPAPDDWGLNDYINHIMVFEGTKKSPEGLRVDLERYKWAPHTENRKWADIEYIRDVEVALSEYIPAALMKIEYDKMIQKLDPLIHGIMRTVPGGQVMRDAKNGILIPKKSEVFVKAPGKGEEYRRLFYDDWDAKNGVMTFRDSDGKEIKIGKSELDWTTVPKKRSERKAYLEANPKYRLQYRNFFKNPKNGKVYGIEHLWKEHGNNNRIIMLRQYLDDVLGSYERGHVERMVDKMTAFHHHQFLGFVNPKSAALNFSQGMMTIAETSLTTTSQATYLLMGRGKSSVKLKNGKNFTKKDARDVVGEVVVKDEFYSQHSDIATTSLQELATLDPKAKGSKIKMAAKMSMALFQMSEMAVRQQAAVAGYIDGINKGGSHDQAIAHAREVVAKTQGIYKKHRAPQKFRRRGGSMVEAMPKAITRKGVVENVLKSTFLIFKRFGFIWSGNAMSMGKEAVRFARTKAAASALGRLNMGKNVRPVVAPNTEEFSELDPKTQQVMREQWGKMSQVERAATQKFWDTSLDDIDKAMAKRAMSTQARLGSSDLYDPTKIVKLAIMVFGAKELAERLADTDIGGTLIALPFDAARIASGSVKRGASGFLDSVTPPTVQLGAAIYEMFDTVRKAGLAENPEDFNLRSALSNSQAHSVIYKTLEKAVVPNSMRLGLRASTGMVSKTDEKSLEHDPERPYGIYSFDKVVRPGTDPVGSVSLATLLKQQFVPGRPIAMREIESAHDEINKAEELYDMLQREQTNRAQNAAYYARKGDMKKATKELQEIERLSELTGSEFTTERMKGIVEKRTMPNSLARRVLTGTKQERWRNFEIVLKKAEKGGSQVMSRKNAEQIFNDLTKSTSGLKHLNRDQIIRTFYEYQKFMKAQ